MVRVWRDGAWPAVSSPCASNEIAAGSALRGPDQLWPSPLGLGRLRRKVLPGLRHPALQHRYLRSHLLHLVVSMVVIRSSASIPGALLGPLSWRTAHLLRVHSTIDHQRAGSSSCLPAGRDGRGPPPNFGDLVTMAVENGPAVGWLPPVIRPLPPLDPAAAPAHDPRQGGVQRSPAGALSMADPEPVTASGAAPLTRRWWPILARRGRARPDSRSGTGRRLRRSAGGERRLAHGRQGPSSGSAHQGQRFGKTTLLSTPSRVWYPVRGGCNSPSADWSTTGPRSRPRDE